MDYNNLTSSYHRLQAYFDILMRDDPYDDLPGIDLSHISSHYNIPIEIVRSDMVTIHKSCVPKISPIIRPDDSCMDDDEADLILEKWCDSENYDPLYKDILRGLYDNLPLTLYEDHSPEYSVSMTEEEYHSLNAILPHTHEKETFKSDMYIKESFRFMSGSDILLEMLETVNQAIDYGVFVSFRYHDNCGVTAEWKIAPLKILYDSITNLYAIITVVKGLISVFRLDRILPKHQGTDYREYIKMTDKTIPNDHEIYAMREHIEEISPYVWGMSYNDKPIKVKVRFEDYGNIPRKISRDLSYRKGTITKKEDGIYYEDTVYGKESFKMWLRGYGSGAEVIKPKALREEIIEALQRHLRSFDEPLSEET